MNTADALVQGRESFDRQSWGDAYAQLSAADQETRLEVGDLERLAVAAYLIGRDEASDDALARAHQECLRMGDTARAVRCAFWLGMELMARGEMAQAGGWMARAARLLEEDPQDCVERGYLLVPGAIQSLYAGDLETAHEKFSQAAEVGDRFRDHDLIAMSRMGLGQSLIRLGETSKGVALLDEVMVAVTSGEVFPILTGVIYCTVIDACQEIFDVRRAQEWTTALTRWCDAHSDLVPFRGQCLIYRAEIMQLHGAWQDALAEAERAGARLSGPPGEPVAGAAFYRQAEVHRLRGEVVKAEETYRQASQWGRSPQPGLALLRLAQGQVNAAEAGIRRVVDEAQDRIARSRLLPAYVEVMLAVDDIKAARAAARDLAELAGDFDAPLLRAVAAHADGAVLLAEGDPRSAVDPLRRAGAAWQELEAPYEAARARVLIGLACKALGDEDSADMELDAARRAFQQLGAAPDLARLDAVSRKPGAWAEGGLTSREVEVLRLVAAGKSNRAIAAELFISEKTVARHVSNIFTKLSLSSRSAATAYAYEHGLV